MIVSTGAKDLVGGIRELPSHQIGEDRFRRALDFLDNGHLQYAKQWFENSLDENSTLGESHIYLGNIFVYQDKFKKAIEEYEKAEKIDRTKLTAQTNKVVAYTALKDFKSAQKILSKLLNSFPDEPSILAVAGFFHWNFCNYDLSISFLEKSIQSGILKKEPYIDLLYLYETYLRNFEKVLEIANLPNLPESLKNDALFLNNYAYGLIKLNKVSDAENILDQFEEGKLLKFYDLSVASSLFATKGLLNIYKEDLAGGNKLYKIAESIAPKEKKDIVKQKRLVENGYFYIRSEEFIDAENLLKQALQLRTPPNVLNYSNEALEYLEIIYQHNKDREFVHHYIRSTNEGIAIEVPINKIPILFSILKQNLISNIVTVTFKENGQHRIVKFRRNQWDVVVRDLIYYFLLSSTLVEWKNANLYSAGYGYYFLELKENQTPAKERILKELEEKL